MPDFQCETVSSSGLQRIRQRRYADCSMFPGVTPESGLPRLLHQPALSGGLPAKEKPCPAFKPV